MADLNFTIGGDASEITRALAELRRQLAQTKAAAAASGGAAPFGGLQQGAASAAQAQDRLQDELRQTTDAAQRAGRGGQLDGLQNDIDQAQAGAGRLQAALALLAGGAAWVAAAREGVQFNAVLEDSAIGIASIISALGDVKDAQGNAVTGQEEFNEALKLGQDQLFKLRVAGLETSATTQELAAAFQQALGPGLSAGLDLDQVRQVTIQLAQAAGALGVQNDQLAQEISSILAGEITDDSRVAKTLGLTNEMVKNWKEQGKLAEELNKRMESFSIAGKAAADTFTVINSNAQEALGALAGDVFSGFFDELKNGIKDSTSGIFDTQTLGVKDELSGLLDFVREVNTQIGAGLAEIMRSAVEIAQAISGWLDQNPEAIDAVTQFGEAVGQYMGLAADAAGGAVDAIGAALGVLAEIYNATYGETGQAINGMTDDLLQMPTTAGEALGLVVTAFRDLPQNVRAFLQILVVEVASRFDAVLARAQFVKDSIAAVFSDDTIEAASARYQARMAAIQGAAQQTIDDALAQRDAAIRESREAVKLAQEKRLQRAAGSGAPDPTKLGSASAPKPPKSESDKKKEAAEAEKLLKAKLDAEEKLNKANTDRLGKILSDYHEDGLISAATYYEARERLQLGALDREIAIQQQIAKASRDQADKVKALAEVQALELQKTEIVRQGARDRAKAEEAAAKVMRDLQIQDLQNQGRTAEAARLRAESGFRDTLKKLQAEGNTAGVALVEKLINASVMEAQFGELRTKFDQLTTDLQSRQAQLADSVRTGQMTGDMAGEQEQQARQQTIDQVTVLVEKMNELAAASGNPEIVAGAQRATDALRKLSIDGMTGVDAAVVNLRASLSQMQQGFAQAATSAGVDAITGLFTDLASGSKSAGDAVNDFVRGFVQSMAQLAARALATMLVLQMLDAIYPGAGQAAVGAMSVGARVKHGGGSAGHGMVRQVDPMLFAAAPRFHSGSGVLGLKAGEIPAILQEGERVQSRAEVAASRQGGAGTGTRVVNVLDPSLAGDYLESAAGEKVIMNVIGRNPGAIKQLLA